MTAGHVDLAPIKREDESIYTAAIGRNPEVTLHFSKEVSRPLPPTLAKLRKVLAAVFVPLAVSDPEAADRRLCLEWRPDDPNGWEIGIADTKHPDWQRGSFPIRDPRDREFSIRNLPEEKDLPGAVKARRELEFVLLFIERDWLAHRRALWLSLKTAERIANQYMSAHLLQSRIRLEEAISRYVGDTALLDRMTIEPADIIRALNAIKKSRSQKAAFDGLVRALIILREMRVDIDLNNLQRQRTVLGVAASVAVLVPVAVAAGVSPDAPEAIEDLKSLAVEAGQRATDVLLTYIKRMRELADDHPILTVLHHITARPMSENSIQRSVIGAVIAVTKAIDALHDVMDTPVVPPLTKASVAPGCDAMMEAIADTSKLSVWKLPIFMDRALRELPKDERLPVDAMRRAALDRKDEELLVREFVMMSVETATMVIPPARAIGFVLSLAVGLARLSGAIQSYDEVTTLYHASLDPAFLALGDVGHAPADADLIVLDIAAMMFDVHGLSKATRAF